MLRIKVNATSANVCVGFDVLGIALNLANEFSFEKAKEVSFFGFEKEYCSTKSNLVYKSYEKVFSYLGEALVPVKIGFKGEIPVSRGLGSSSSLIVAGVFAANYFATKKLSKDELFNICCELEGHPDNVAPAVYGGFVASYKENNNYKAISYPISNDLKFIAIIPPFPLSTNAARKALPEKLSYADITNNLSRIIHLPKALASGDIQLLKELFNDKLHEPYRGKLIKGYLEIKSICEKENAAFAISGSGSTMLIITKDEGIIEKIKKFNYSIKTLEVGNGVTLWEE